MQPLFLASQQLLTAHWAAVERLLAPVVEHARGDYNLADLENLCRDGHAICLVLFDPHPVLALVLEWRRYPRRTVLNIIAIGGKNLGAARTLWPELQAFARESGASDIEARVRPAMARMLRPLGFDPAYEIVRCPLESTACR
jgi:hypothetical protein